MNLAGFWAEHWLKVLLVPTAVVWALILGPVLLRSAQRNGEVLSLIGLYLAGLVTPLGILIDPSAATVSADVVETSVWVDRVNQLAIVLSLAVGFAALVGLLGRRGRPQAIAVTLVGYLLVVAFSGLLNGPFEVRFIALPMLALAVAAASLERRHLTTHLRYITRATTISSLWLLATSYEQVVFTENGRQLLGFDQLSGATTHPNVLGPLAAFALAIELAPGVRRRSALGITAAVTVCALAQSRAGWICALVVLLVWLTSSRRRRAPLGVLSYVGGLTAIVWLAVRSYIAGPLFPISFDDVLTGREQVWQLALLPFHESPIIGGGPDVFGEEFRATHGQFGAVVGQAHNQVLETMAEAGLLGLAAFLVLALVWLSAARHQWRDGAWLPLAALLMLAVDGLVESPLRLVLLPPTFMVFAAAALLRSHSDSPVQAEPPVRERVAHQAAETSAS